MFTICIWTLLDIVLFFPFPFILSSLHQFILSSSLDDWLI